MLGVSMVDFKLFWVLVLVAVISAVGASYVIWRWIQTRQADDDPVEQFHDRVAGQDSVALLVPEGADIDSLAAALGLQAILTEWGASTTLYAAGDITSEDSKAFLNIFDVDITVLDDGRADIGDTDLAIAIGGGGSVPRFGRHPPVAAVIRHRPTAEDDIISLTRTDHGSTSTIVTALIQEFDTTIEQREATALLYGIRAGTREFRRANGIPDYEAAGYLHQYADLGKIEDLRSPGMSGDTFDVIGDAIHSRERDSSLVVSNVGGVPNVSALEEAAEALLRLEGVSTAAVFGMHEETIVVSCRSDDVRTNALDLLEEAFDDYDAAGGASDAATARIPLGLFADVDGEQEDTLDDLLDTSTRRALFSAFEST